MKYFKTKDDYRVVEDKGVYYVYGMRPQWDSHFSRTTLRDGVLREEVEVPHALTFKRNFWGDPVSVSYKTADEHDDLFDSVDVKRSYSAPIGVVFYKHLEFKTCKEAFDYIDSLLKDEPKVISREDCANNQNNKKI